MKLKTLLALDILNNSAASAQQLKWAKMTDEEKLAARQKEEFPWWFKVFIYLSLVAIAVYVWYITIPVLIGIIIYKSKKRKESKCESQKEQ